jgi:hypothetical protein
MRTAGRCIIALARCQKWTTVGVEYVSWELMFTSKVLTLASGEVASRDVRVWQPGITEVPVKPCGLTGQHTPTAVVSAAEILEAV